MNMKTRRTWIVRLTILFVSFPLLQGGCTRLWQREMEVLVAHEASPTLINQSFLFNRFGPAIWQVIKYW